MVRLRDIDADKESCSKINPFNTVRERREFISIVWGLHTINETMGEIWWKV